MTLFAAGNLCWVAVSAEGHGGCGASHGRPVENGAPVKIWALECPPCEDHLRHDPMWATTVAEIPETYDEKLVRENFEKRGALDERKIMVMAFAQFAGLEVPESISGALGGKMPHIPGMLVCPQGHDNAAGKRFCGDCGESLSAPATKTALPAPPRVPERVPEPSAPVGRPAQGGKPRRLRDARLDELQALAKAHGLDESGKRPVLISRLGAAGVTSADLGRLPVAA